MPSSPCRGIHDGGQLRAVSSSGSCASQARRIEHASRRHPRRSQLSDHAGQQRGDHGLGGLAGLDDLGVAERALLDAGGEVGDEEKPSTSIPAWRAAIASSAVDMPTMWPPIALAICTSAGVS
jgi:hypothetical protein